MNARQDQQNHVDARVGDGFGTSLLTYLPPTANAVRRKAGSVVGRGRRAVKQLASSYVDYAERPPVIANSFPKSGTHLLRQLADALPATVDYGTFIASVPPIRHRPRSAHDSLRKICAIAPGELVRAHLWYSPEAVACLRRVNAVHLFIYRDLRDVAVSETHYLTEMAPWHALHRHFARLPTMSERLMLAIRGLPPDHEGVYYPGIGRRFAAYAGWLADESVVGIRYEDLTSGDLDAELTRIAKAMNARVQVPMEPAEFARAARAAIDPKRSHTFRVGRVGGWRAAFGPEHCEAMLEEAGTLLVDLGYESGLDWSAQPFARQ